VFCSIPSAILPTARNSRNVELSQNDGDFVGALDCDGDNDDARESSRSGVSEAERLRLGACLVKCPMATWHATIDVSRNLKQRARVE